MERRRGKEEEREREREREGKRGKAMQPSCTEPNPRGI